jgi:hypothetical protein
MGQTTKVDCGQKPLFVLGSDEGEKNLEKRGRGKERSWEETFKY